MPLFLICIGVIAGLTIYYPQAVIGPWLGGVMADSLKVVFFSILIIAVIIVSLSQVKVRLVTRRIIGGVWLESKSISL